MDIDNSGEKHFLGKAMDVTVLLIVLTAAGLACICIASLNITPTEVSIAAIDNEMSGKLVAVTGSIGNIRKSKSGNVYWDVSDDSMTEGESITVPLLSSKFKNLVAKRGDAVEIIGLVSEYNGEMEIMPKEIHVA